MRREQTELWVSSVGAHGARWRFRIGRGREVLGTHSFATEVEAKKARAATLKAIDEKARMTLEAALAGYQRYIELAGEDADPDVIERMQALGIQTPVGD